MKNINIILLIAKNSFYPNFIIFEEKKIKITTEIFSGIHSMLHFLTEWSWRAISILENYLTKLTGKPFVSQIRSRVSLRSHTKNIFWMSWLKMKMYLSCTFPIQGFMVTLDWLISARYFTRVSEWDVKLR